jgi:hypothetical protein
MPYRSTRDVAKLLGVGLARLSRAVYEGRIEPPPRGPGGVFLWDDFAIRKAGWVLLRRDVADLLTASPEVADHAG